METKAQVIAQFEEQLSFMEKALHGMSSCLLGQGWIVECEGVYLNFEILDGIANNPKVAGLPHKAQRFTERDASAIAEQVRNGRESVGRAVHVMDALEYEIEQIKRLIDFMKK